MYQSTYYDYDEFNIYTTIDDVEEYIESLFIKGHESKDEIYNLCLDYFGQNCINIIDMIFNEED